MFKFFRSFDARIDAIKTETESLADDITSRKQRVQAELDEVMAVQRRFNNELGR